MDDTYIEAQPASLTTVTAKSNPLNYFTWWMPVFVIAWLIAYLSMFSDPVGLLQQNWPLFFVGFIGAVLGNATAVGGGIIFIPVMIFIYQLPAVTALKLAIASQSFGMTSGALGWLKRGIVPTKLLWVTIPPLLVGSLISSLVIKPNAFLVKGLFGPASIFIGAITLILIGRYGGHEDIPTKGYLPLAFMSLIGGTLTGWVAIGEGEVVAAFLMLVYGLRAEKGIGLGVVLLAINSIFLALLHQIFLGGIPWELAMFTAFGCVFGGRMGPYLSQWIGPKKLKISFAFIAILDGILFLYQFIVSYL
jgi:uncharacterized protein